MTAAKPKPKRSSAIDAQLGKRLRHLRRLRGMSQTDLGNLLGVTFQQIQKYERGKNRVSADRLFRISRLFGVEVIFFFEDLPLKERATRQ